MRVSERGIEPMPRDAWVEIDEEALREDHRALRAALPESTAIGVVVKADAYGHGIVDVGRLAVDEGADWLLVATLEEGLILRGADIERPILVMYPIPHRAAPMAAQARLTVTAGSMLDARRLAEASDPALPLDVHLEIDTGMTRGGVMPAEVVAVATTIAASPSLHHAGTWSHLAQPEDPAVTSVQAARFEEAVRSMRAAGIEPGVRHIGSSGAVLCGVSPLLDLVRVGLAWYGIVPPEWSTERPALAAALRPALSVRARAIRIAAVPRGARVGYGGTWIATRDSLIATLPLGYADGYPRSEALGAEALIRGRRVPMVGRVSMDALTVDVTSEGVLDPDEVFTIIGEDGGHAISAVEVARRRGTIAWEVLATLGSRLPRVYVRTAIR